MIVQVARLVQAAKAMLESYARGVNSGDWGHWDLEDDDEYVRLRAAVEAVESIGRTP